ncbi:MAG: HYR domain-containing protein [Bacteroidia bacterium]
MRKSFTLFFVLLLSLGLGGHLMACNLSSVTLTSVVYNSGPGNYTINFQLNVGQGRTGNVTGADGDTRTIAIALYRSCGNVAILSVSPTQLPGAFTACNMPGSNLGPQGPPYNCQALYAYIDPGYYGVPPCVSQPFACITSTALCGNVQSVPYNFSLTVSAMPDSLRIMGVEGSSNPIGGCYPNADMKIDFNQGMIQCPGPQTFAANPNCQGTLPSYSAMVTSIFGCTNPGAPTIVQSPGAGSNIGGLGTTATITMTATFPNSNVSSCTFTATVADLTPPNLTCPSNSTVALDANCQWTVPALSATATDNCSSSPNITQSPTGGTTLTGASTTTVTVTAADAAGNTSTCAVVITAADQTAPTISCPPNDTVTLSNICQGTVPSYTASASDNCTANPTVGQSPAGGTNLTSGGTYPITFTATDASGNTSTCSMNLVAIPPSISGTTTVTNANPCDGDTVTLASTATGSAYFWSNGATTNSTDVTSSGWYWVDVTIAGGCVVRDSIQLNFLPAPPPPVITQTGNQVCTGVYAGYQWFFNGTAIPGATSQCHTMTLTGVYTVVVTGANGCTSRSVAFSAVSVAEQIQNEFTVYPVPATTEVKLRLPVRLEEAGGIRLYDLTGRAVRAWSFGSLDLETGLNIDGLAGGTYILELKVADWAAVRKVVKLD